MRGTRTNGVRCYIHPVQSPQAPARHRATVLGFKAHIRLKVASMGARSSHAVSLNMSSNSVFATLAWMASRFLRYRMAGLSLDFL